MAPYWLLRRDPGGYETIDLDEPGYDDGNRLRSILRGEELEKAMEGRQIRVAIGCVSAAMGLYVIYRVWRDSYKQSRLDPRAKSSRFSFIWQLHPAEVFPLIMGFTIFYPTIILVAIQGTGLSSIAVDQCRTTGAVALPAILALGMFHLVYGLEVTIRACSSIPFRKASKWRTTINLTFVGSFLLFIFIVGITLGDFQDRCFGSVGFRVASLKVNKGIFVLLSILIFAFLTMAVIITIRLMQVVHLDPNERIAASRMVYYLVVSTVFEILLLPFFIQEYFETEDSQLTASTVAEYIIFSSGAILAFVHLFLRANASSTAIRPRATPWQGRGGLRMFGHNDLQIRNISRPINIAPPSSYDPDEKYAEFVARQESMKRIRSQRRKAPGNPLAQKANISSPIPIPQESLPALTSIKSPLPRTELPNISPTTPFGKDMGHNLLLGADEPKLLPAVYSPLARSASKKFKTETRSLKSPTIPPPVPRKPALQLQTDISPPAPEPIELEGLPTSSVPDVRDFSSEAQELMPPKAPWIHHRNDSSSSSATVQIGIRISSADSAVLPSIAYRRPSSTTSAEVGILPTLAYRRPSSTVLPSTVYQPSANQKTAAQLARSRTSPQAIKFASGLQTHFNQSIAGRDLNSFRWIDTPNEEEAPGSPSRIREYFPISAPNNRPGHASMGDARNQTSPESAASAMSEPPVTERRWV